jgi:hypothetical protein
VKEAVKEAVPEKKAEVKVEKKVEEAPKPAAAPKEVKKAAAKVEEPKQAVVHGSRGETRVRWCHLDCKQEELTRRVSRSRCRVCARGSLSA